MAVAAEQDDQVLRWQRQQANAVGKYQAISQPGELAWEETVFRQDGSQPRKSGETGIGCHCQDQHGADLYQVI